MVCPLYKRALSAFFAALLLSSAGLTELSWAKYPDKTTQQDNQLGLSDVHLSPDASTLLFNSNRPLNQTETRSLSVLRFPSPYRLVVEIPNAHLLSNRTVFPISKNGVDRVELSQNNSQFYSAVRATIYVNDSQTLSLLNPAFNSNQLAIQGLPKLVVAVTPEQQAEPINNVSTLVTTTKNYKTYGKAQPLPPVTKPTPAMMALQPALPSPMPQAEQPQLAMNQQTVLNAPVAPGTNIIEEAYFRDNRFVMKGNNGSDLRVKNRFLLTAPNRLVLDIDNSVLRSKALMAPIYVPSGDIRQIRVGQFDEKTVRVVIEGQMPEQYEAIYSGADRSLLAVSPYSSTSITKLSSNTRLGQIESIDLKRDSGGTVLRLEASAPIVHRFVKKDNRVVLDLLNEAANPTNISVDNRKYPEVAQMRLEPLTEGQPNSKLAIILASPNMKVTPNLSPDGKVLEICMVPSRDADAPINNLLGSMMGPAGNAPYPARIVIDAGHGGKDLGANREGVNEKDLNLSLAQMVRESLEAKGFKVYMTRSTDVFLPLPEISAITNRIHPDLFISIHHNASVNPALSGIETYYYTPQSLALARRVQARKINAVGARDGGVKRAMFYVIHHTEVPAILCEVGYVSNPDERAELQTIERKSKTARAIADGVVDYLKASVSARAKAK